MDAIKNVAQKFSAGIDKGYEIATFAVTRCEPLEKVAKITCRTISAAEAFFNGLSGAMTEFNSQLKDSILVFETMRLVGIMSFLACPKNGKYFLTNPETSWQKCVDRVTLAIHCAFKNVKGLNKFGFVGLGVMAKDAIGKLPIFTLAMDSFILASSFFSTWDSLGVHMPKVRKNIADADKKLDKWEYRLTAISLLKAGDEIERKCFEEKYNNKAVELQERGENLEKKIPESIAESKKTFGALLLRTTIKQIHNDDRINKIASGNTRALAEDLQSKNIDLKVRKWETVKANAQQEQSKTWLRIANSVWKFAVVVFALVLTATSSWTSPYLIPCITMGIMSDSIGLSKILVEEFWKAKPVPTNFAAAAA